jgi:hypothetical protein
MRSDEHDKSQRRRQRQRRCPSRGLVSHMLGAHQCSATANQGPGAQRITPNMGKPSVQIG